MAKRTHTLLQQEFYDEIFRSFQSWRISDFVKQLNAKKAKGRVLPFVRGLRLSAQLIYTIRDLISETNLEVDWGHILDDNGEFLSNECDIIIHKKGFVRKWNGKNGCVMDFRFIARKNAIAVISCKSLLTSSVLNSERSYCNQMKPFVKKMWIFAECCTPATALSIEQKAKEIGFAKCWYSYTWDKKTDKIVENTVGWNDFIREVEKLIRPYKKP